MAITEEMGLTLQTHTPEKALNIPTRELAPHIERQQDEEYTAGVHQRIEFKIVHLYFIRVNQLFQLSIKIIVLETLAGST